MPPSCPQARDPVRNKVFIVAQSRLAFMPGAVPKEAKSKGKDKEAKEGCVRAGCARVCIRARVHFARRVRSEAALPAA